MEAQTINIDSNNMKNVETIKNMIKHNGKFIEISFNVKNKDNINDKNFMNSLLQICNEEIKEDTFNITLIFENMDLKDNEFEKIVDYFDKFLKNRQLKLNLLGNKNLSKLPDSLYDYNIIDIKADGTNLSIKAPENMVYISFEGEVLNCDMQNNAKDIIIKTHANLKEININNKVNGKIRLFCKKNQEFKINGQQYNKNLVLENIVMATYGS